VFEHRGEDIVIDKDLRKIFEMGVFKGKILFDQYLSDYTSLKIGGPVDLMVFPEDLPSLKNVLITANREQIPFFILGAGTNILVSDNGVEGVAISLKAFRRIEIIRNLQRIAPYLFEGGGQDIAGLFIESGAMLGSVINFAKDNGFSGIEELVGIPGTFGGAVFMNAGSFGREMKDVVISVAIMKTDGNIVILDRDELDFAYRNLNIPHGSVIISANVALRLDRPENITNRIAECIKKRRKTQPLGFASAGCVFKNPEGDYAGRLIEAAGCKGMRVGDVEVSEIHANYFINKGSGRCTDFLRLMDEVKKRVAEHSGVLLEPEIKIVGRDF
jgi:UDP-N-acetylmuramate dehydrogenase